MKNNLNLIWIDLEMTGLNPDINKIIEIATVVTDKDLNIIADGPNIAIFQEDDKLDIMDKWNTKHHNKSGLVDRVKKSEINEQMAERKTIKFLKQYINANQSPMCGNSICMDKMFLVRYMPKLAQFFHYRQIDVSTIKELVTRWMPSIKENNKKESSHLALRDIYDSITELKYYRKHFIKQ